MRYIIKRTQRTFTPVRALTRSARSPLLSAFSIQQIDGHVKFSHPPPAWQGKSPTRGGSPFWSMARENLNSFLHGVQLCAVYCICATNSDFLFFSLDFHHSCFLMPLSRQPTAPCLFPPNRVIGIIIWIEIA